MNTTASRGVIDPVPASCTRPHSFRSKSDGFAACSRKAFDTTIMYCTFRAISFLCDYRSRGNGVNLLSIR